MGWKQSCGGLFKRFKKFKSLKAIELRTVELTITLTLTLTKSCRANHNDNIFQR